MGEGKGPFHRRPTFRELRNRASRYLHDKLRQARLALTGMTTMELLTKEATSGRHDGPDARTLKGISRAAFEVDDYWRIVDVLHKRLKRLDKKRWRAWYQALTVLEHMVIHGPDSASREFQLQSDTIRRQAAEFHYIDERGIDWDQAVRKRSERVLQLLERGPLLQEERDRARAVIRGIQRYCGGGSDDVMLTPSGPTHDETEKDCSTKTSVVGASKQEEEEEKDGSLKRSVLLDPSKPNQNPRSCSRRRTEMRVISKEQEWGHEMMLWRGGATRNGAALTFGAIYGNAATALAEESMPLLACS